MAKKDKAPKKVERKLKHSVKHNGQSFQGGTWMKPNHKYYDAFVELGHFESLEDENKKVYADDGEDTPSNDSAPQGGDTPADDAGEISLDNKLFSRQICL